MIKTEHIYLQWWVGLTTVRCLQSFRRGTGRHLRPVWVLRAHSVVGGRRSASHEHRHQCWRVRRPCTSWLTEKASLRWCTGKWPTDRRQPPARLDERALSTPLQQHPPYLQPTRLCLDARMSVTSTVLFLYTRIINLAYTDDVHWRVFDSR